MNLMPPVDVLFIYVAARIRVLYLCLPYQEFKKLYNSLVCRTQVGGASVQLRLGLIVAGTTTICSRHFVLHVGTELVFLNVYGAPESVPRNEFRQPT